MFFIKYPR